MIILGIILVVLGLLLFMAGGAMSNDNPGVERPHLVLVGLGFVLVIVGGVMVTRAVL
ncbi:hypothetical protein HYS28_03780 [Candidatus Uhrbacteria bacterium]|nr:hypothetical protein [Candidatus Uhrbacteria bacterium]